MELGDTSLLCYISFREQRATSVAVMELVEAIATSIDNKEFTVGIFLDLKKKKASDTMGHTISLNHLARYGRRGVAYTVKG